MTQLDTRVLPLPPPLGRLAWLLLGMVALCFALLGFVLPIIPGLPFAMLAGLCFANVSARVHGMLAGVPAMRGVMGQWRRAQRGSVGTQMTAAGWLMALGLVETVRLAWAALVRLWIRS